jgi:hypothetical protein
MWKGNQGQSLGRPIGHGKEYERTHCPNLCFLVGGYSFKSYVSVFHPFQVDFCMWCWIKLQLHSSACRNPGSSNTISKKSVLGTVVKDLFMSPFLGSLLCLTGL